MLRKQLGDAPIGYPCAVLEMAVDAAIGHGLPVDDFVDRFVAVVAVGHGKFRALLEVDDEGHRNARRAGPAHRGPLPAVADEVARRRRRYRVGRIGGWLGGCHGSWGQNRAGRRMPTSRPAANSTTTANRMRQDEMAAMLGSGDSSR